MAKNLKILDEKLKVLIKIQTFLNIFFIKIALGKCPLGYATEIFDVRFKISSTKCISDVKNLTVIL